MLIMKSVAGESNNKEYRLISDWCEIFLLTKFLKGWTADPYHYNKGWSITTSKRILAAYVNTYYIKIQQISFSLRIQWAD